MLHCSGGSATPSPSFAIPHGQWYQSGFKLLSTHCSQPVKHEIAKFIKSGIRSAPLSRFFLNLDCAAEHVFEACHPVSSRINSDAFTHKNLPATRQEDV